MGLFLTFTTLHRRIGLREDEWGGVLANKAERIAGLLDVPLVSMGHTHDAILRPFRKKRCFANSGTWIRQTVHGCHQTEVTSLRLFVVEAEMDVMR